MSLNIKCMLFYVGKIRMLELLAYTNSFGDDILYLVRGAVGVRRDYGEKSVKTEVGLSVR